MSEQQTALTVQARASLALGTAEHEKRLIELAKGSTAIVAITNQASYQECHSARMALKKARVEIEKTGKAARDDAQVFAKAVIAEEKRLIAIIAPEEVRLATIQTEHDTRIARELQEKIDAEAARMKLIQDCLAEITAKPGTLAGKPSSAISVALHDMNNHDVTTWADEFKPEAEAAKAKAIATLELMYAGTLAQEQAAAAEAARIKAEREELARLRAEQQERDRTEQARIAEETRRRLEEEAAARAKIEAEERASRERIEAQERAARQEREEADRKAKAVRDAEEANLRAIREEEEKRLRAEREQLERERLAAAERDRKIREAAEAKAKAKREKEEAAERERQRKANELMDARQMLEAFVTRFGHIKEFAGVVKAIEACADKELKAA